jgi:hypothetical protein
MAAMTREILPAHERNVRSPQTLGVSAQTEDEPDFDIARPFTRCSRV